MKRPIAIRLCFVLCITSSIFTACSSNSDDGDGGNETGDLTTLEVLKALFDNGDITHIDFETAEQRVLLDEEIESMTIVANDDIFGFKLLKIVTMSPPLSENTPDALRQRHTTSLTFSDQAEPIVIDDNANGNWAETVISINGVIKDDFAPRANLFDSEITTSGLVVLKDKLRMKFIKK
ncbi:hypothetical protein [Seonamhaeicola marinus]|uniref:Uncharacterized protein n=1 Tax=Seonamhaeicola marinus TaxID=1912246 RepID=A0A5D0HXR9_9FLAO|nr:hypothetical protein [Seonamhaeicola marinus]TYA74947.1 hypothetical protein FUA24_16745 [Seonamhaeicola marinus]